MLGVEGGFTFNLTFFCKLKFLHAACTIDAIVRVAFSPFWTALGVRGGAWRSLGNVKRQSPGQSPDLLSALRPAASPLWDRARHVLVCVLGKVVN